MSQRLESGYAPRREGGSGFAACVLLGFVLAGLFFVGEHLRGGAADPWADRPAVKARLTR